MQSNSAESVIALVLAIIILMYALRVLMDKKSFGDVSSDLTQMVLGVFTGFFKWYFNLLKKLFWGKPNKPKKRRRNQRRRGRHN